MHQKIFHKLFIFYIKVAKCKNYIKEIVATRISDLCVTNVTVTGEVHCIGVISSLTAVESFDKKKLFNEESKIIMIKN